MGLLVPVGCEVAADGRAAEPRASGQLGSPVAGGQLAVGVARDGNIRAAWRSCRGLLIACAHVAVRPRPDGPSCGPHRALIVDRLDVAEALVRPDRAREWHAVP